MKKIIGIMVLFVSLFSLSGCKKIDLSYFEERVKNIEGYKYYTISEEVYRDDLLLYSNEKSVYYNDNKVKYVTNIKEVSDLDNEELYDEETEEYYSSGEDLYYYEDGEWKSRKVSTTEAIGVTLNKEIFESYTISEKNNKKYLNGKVKSDSFNVFLGFDIEEVDTLVLDIEVSSKDLVNSIVLSYVSSSGNKVIVSLKLNYSYVLDFSLPSING